VLTCHEDSNHHVSDIRIGKFDAVLVCAPSQGCNHIVLILVPLVRRLRNPLRRTYRNDFAGPPLPDDVPVKFADLLVRLIPPDVDGQGQIGEHEIDGDKPGIEIPEKFGELRVKAVADLLALQRARGCEDDQF
jgi:hypothetical protein